MKLFAAILIVSQVLLIDFLILKPAHHDWQDAPIVHGPWENYANHP
jgi:hypothetical protein